MIRINLLTTERKAEKKKSAAAPGVVQAYLFLGLFGGGAALVCAGGFWLKTAQLKELDTRIAESETRQRQLQAIKKQVEDFEAKKKLIAQKVELIDKLKADQAAAVHMLDELSKALPEFVWLSQMDNTATGLKLTGLRAVKILGSARPGETVRIEASVTGRLGLLVQAQACAFVSGTKVLSAELTLSGAAANGHSDPGSAR